MEPITLCGLVIVAFGVWIEFESMAKALANAAYGSKMLKKIMAMTTAGQKSAYANRYASYPR